MYDMANINFLIPFCDIDKTAKNVMEISTGFRENLRYFVACFTFFKFHCEIQFQSRQQLNSKFPVEKTAQEMKYFMFDNMYSMSYLITWEKLCKSAKHFEIIYFFLI